jgi:methionyl-tRNA synthetase
MEAIDLRGGADAAWGLVSDANGYIQQSAPWTLAKQGRDADLDLVLGTLARCLYRLAVLTSPFIPGKSQALWEALGMAGEVAAAPWASLADPPVAGVAATKPEVLFPKPAPA